MPIWRSRDWTWIALLVVLITGMWVYEYRRYDLKSWRTPLSYVGDAWGEMATAKAYAADGVLPVLLKYPRSLGAPFVASWNDHLTAEEGLFVWYAGLVRVFGLFTGSNIAVLVAHLLASLSLFVVCREIGCAKPISAMCGLLYAMSHFAFARSLPHLVLTYYWHVPLGLLTLWWCLCEERIIFRPVRFTIAALIAVAHGVQFPYYTGLYLQFLALVTVVLLFRRRPFHHVIAPIVLICIVLAAFLTINLDTIYYRVAHGPNLAVTVRSYAGLELYALKPIELFLPTSHRIHALESWTNRAYVSQALYIGEGGSPYLGVVAIIGLLWMVVESIVHISRNELQLVAPSFWAVLWIFAYSCVGGINAFFGLFGMVLFRCTNRYSIVIMALALLFLAEQLTRLLHHRKSLLLSTSAALALAGLWDQSPIALSAAQVQQTERIVDSDRNLVKVIEKALPARAMVFELPVMNYPEVPPIHAMGDYEPLRPYLHSHNLRFSYGSDKGRPRERWQEEAEHLPAAAMATVLDRYGFSAVLVNRKGYSDRAASLVDAFVNSGKAWIMAQNNDFVCLRLAPDGRPILPPEFDQHWYGIEGTFENNWRWSDGNATITFYNNLNVPRVCRVTFRIGAVAPMQVKVFAASENVATIEANADQPSPPQILRIELQPGATSLHFQTDHPAILPQNGDTRKLAFDLIDFTLQE